MNELNSTANELDEKNRSALLKIIDFKTESDMDKVLSKMEHMFAQTNAKMDAKFTQIDNKFAHIEESITTVRWVIIVAGGVLGAILTIMATKIS